MRMTFCKFVRPEDLNPANRLFGGRMMEWADEAAALYAMSQLQTKQIVTLKVSEMLFQSPAQQGDILEFYCQCKSIGRTSITIDLAVHQKEITGPPPSAPLPERDPRIILKCEFVFVSVDHQGKPTPHGL